MASVREIAERAGVSKSTVSLVLNNKPGVSAQMRQAVMHAAEQLKANNAQTNNSHHTLPTNKQTIAVFHPAYLRSSYVFKEVLRGIQTAAAKHNLELRLAINQPNQSSQHIAQIYLNDPSLRPDGVLIFGAKQKEPLVDEAQRLGIPCVVLGRDILQYDVSGISRQETVLARQATEHLIQLGHQHIAFAGGDTNYDFLHTRLAGYRQALEAHDITPQNRWVALGNGGNALDTLLSEAPEITAVLFVNDTYANEAFPIIHKRSLQIPQDLSIVSFDNTDIARNFTPPLTSVSYKQYEEGQWAVKILLDQIQYPYLQHSHVIFEAELVVRDSTTTAVQPVQSEKAFINQP